MNINFKRGLKRMYITLLCIIAIPTFIIFGKNGFIMDNYKFESKINVKIDNQQLIFSDFLKQYVDPLLIFETKCYPYQQKCIINSVNKEFQNNKVYELKKDKQTKEFLIQMPTRLQYFYWQFLDFIKILCYFLIAYSLYLFAEQIIIWIIKGFKND